MARKRRTRKADNDGSETQTEAAKTEHAARVVKTVRYNDDIERRTEGNDGEDTAAAASTDAEPETRKRKKPFGRFIDLRLGINHLRRR